MYANRREAEPQPHPDKLMNDALRQSQNRELEEVTHPITINPDVLAMQYLRRLQAQSRVCAVCKQSVHYRILRTNFGAAYLAVGFCPHGCSQGALYQDSVLISELRTGLAST